eukprot:scaffold7365_cov67-Isochrysis_galbana.AAC.1
MEVKGDVQLLVTDANFAKARAQRTCSRHCPRPGSPPLLTFPPPRPVLGLRAARSGRQCGLPI